MPKINVSRLESKVAFVVNQVYMNKNSVGDISCCLSMKKVSFYREWYKEFLSQKYIPLQSQLDIAAFHTGHLIKITALSYRFNHSFLKCDFDSYMFALFSL